MAFLAILGPTASGKSALAMRIALEANGEIVGCDSVQVYRGFDVGAAKPGAEERAQVPHHMIDVLLPHENFDAATYGHMARACIADIQKRGRLPIVVGGTWLYYRALVMEQFHDLPQSDLVRQELEKKDTAELAAMLAKVDPKRAAELHPNDRYRTIRALEIYQITGVNPSEHFAKAIPEAGFLPSEVKVLMPPRDVLHERIAQRTEAMFALGFVEEVEGLLRNGVAIDAAPMRSIGYIQVAAWIASGKQSSLDEVKLRVLYATRQYAKRQCTWLRSHVF